MTKSCPRQRVVNNPQPPDPHLAFQMMSTHQLQREGRPASHKMRQAREVHFQRIRDSADALLLAVRAMNRKRGAARVRQAFKVQARQAQLWRALEAAAVAVAATSRTDPEAREL